MTVSKPAQTAFGAHVHIAGHWALGTVPFGGATSGCCTSRNLVLALTATYVATFCQEKKAKHGKRAKVDRPGRASSDSEDDRPAVPRSPVRTEPSHHRSVPAPSNRSVADTAADRPSDRSVSTSGRGEKPSRDRIREDRFDVRGADRDAHRDSVRHRGAERTTGRDPEADDRRSDVGRGRRDEGRHQRPRSRSRSPRRR